MQRSEYSPHLKLWKRDHTRSFLVKERTPDCFEEMEQENLEEGLELQALESAGIPGIYIERV